MTQFLPAGFLDFEYYALYEFDMLYFWENLVLNTEIRSLSPCLIPTTTGLTTNVFPIFNAIKTYRADKDQIYNPNLGEL